MTHFPLPADEPTWSIAAASRATGLTQHTLRAWERRFGFPQPVRLPSGHRRFTSEQVEQLKLIKRALDQGHRASAVVPLPLERLRALLPPGGPGDDPAGQWCSAALDQLVAFNLAAIAHALRRAAATLGVRTFLKERVIPLLDAVGQRWAAGALDIRHEHLLSQVVEDELRALRLRLEPAAHGRPLLLAALPGESHALALHIVAVAATARGRLAHILGPHSPLEEIVATARATHAEVVGITVSAPTATPATSTTLNQLHAAVAPGVEVWVGGAGSRLLVDLHPEILVIHDLATLDEQLDRLEGTAQLRADGRGRRGTRASGRRS